MSLDPEPVGLPAVPAGGPADLAVVATRCKVVEATDPDDFDLVTSVVLAVNDVVRRLPQPLEQIVRHVDDTPELNTWSPSTIHGATMLCIRVFRRKNTPAGVESFVDGGVAYVRRTDPDIAMMLGIGPDWDKPRVG